jgi:hypothetical protein
VDAAIRNVRPMDGDGVTPTGRRSVRVAAGERASFDTFFNAFPAGYWRRWTPVQATAPARLRVVAQAPTRSGKLSTGQLTPLRSGSSKAA